MSWLLLNLDTTYERKVTALYGSGCIEMAILSFNVFAAGSERKQKQHPVCLGGVYTKRA